MITVTMDPAAFLRQLPGWAAVIEAVLVEELTAAAGGVAAKMRRTWPRKTGLSAEGFEVVSIPGGARLQNAVSYVPHIHRRGTSTLALDELTGPAIEAAIRDVPQRAAESAARRIR